jgi:hypothetical protein
LPPANKIKMTNKKKPTIQEPDWEISEEEKSQKIQSLHDMIASAEKTIQSAKAMLLQIEGKKKSGRKRKIESNIDGDIVTGTFDGQIMVGSDSKQYPVPANYASKSKLVEGDMLKLTITPEGSFIYKQIGPAERRHSIGIASQDERGNFYIIADGKPYRVLLASVTYFRVEPGDEVAIVISRDIESSWAAIDNVLQKGKEKMLGFGAGIKSEPEKDDKKSLLDEWTTDIDEIEKEVKKE